MFPIVGIDIPAVTTITAAKSQLRCRGVVVTRCQGRGHFEAVGRCHLNDDQSRLLFPIPFDYMVGLLSNSSSKPPTSDLSMAYVVAEQPSLLFPPSPPV